MGIRTQPRTLPTLLTIMAVLLTLIVACGAPDTTGTPDTTTDAPSPADMPAEASPAGDASPTTDESPPAEESPAAEASPAAEDDGAAAVPEGAPFTIGVSNGFVGSEWRTQMIQDLEEVNAEYQEAGLTEDLIIESADVDVQGQTQQIRNLINRGVDAIIVNPNSQTALNSVIQEATDAGIVVIAVDQEVSVPSAINVVIDQTEWARMSARWLVEQLGGEGDVVVINGIAGHPANEARWQGVQEVFGENPGINVLNVANANWDQATGQQVMSNFLASQPNIDGVWTQDGMAEGALRAVVAANPSEWPVMVGEARAGYLKLWHEIKQDRPEFTSFGVVNPPGVGASGLRIAVELLQGRELADDALGGPFDNSLYVPIPGTVSEENFEEEYEKIADLPDSYTLDGIISQEEAEEFFQ